MNRKLSATRQIGLSLIEIMVALTLGLIVVGAVGGIFLSTSRSYTQDELLSRMQENARYALHVLKEDLSMAGYWGPLMSGDDINTTLRSCNSSSTGPECAGFFALSALTLTTDCNPGTVSASPWATNIDLPVEFMKEVASGTAAAVSFGCIDGTEFLPDTGILVVKRVEGEELASDRDSTDDVGEVFIRTNGSDAMLFTYATDLDGSEGADITDWRYRANIYYIRDYFLNPGDNIPTLVRKRLVGDDMVTESGGVAQGVEDFHVMFGVDTDSDATANLYKSNPSVAELEDVTSARIYVLVRSVAEDFAYINDRTYNLGDVTKDFSGSPDNFYRRVFATTVTLHNTRNRILTTGN